MKRLYLVARKLKMYINEWVPDGNTGSNTGNDTVPEVAVFSKKKTEVERFGERRTRNM